MSFKEQLVVDQTDTYYRPDELGCVREFKFLENGLEKRVVTDCAWDTEILKTRVIVQQQGLFMGTVLLFIYKHLFAVPPRPENIIYTREREVNPITLEPLPSESVLEAWRVIDVTDAETAYEIYLDKVIA